jgi:hypothetical protein
MHKQIPRAWVKQDEQNEIYDGNAISSNDADVY